MVTTTGRIKAGTFVGPELTHYTTTGGMNFTNPVHAALFFELIAGFPTAGQPGARAAQIAIIGELKTASGTQRFALEAGSGWTAAHMSTLTAQTVVEVPY